MIPPGIVDGGAGAEIAQELFGRDDLVCCQLQANIEGWAFFKTLLVEEGKDIFGDSCHDDRRGEK